MSLIGIIILIAALIPMVSYYHRKASQESYDATVERLKDDPAALKLFKDSRLGGL